MKTFTVVLMAAFGALVVVACDSWPPKVTLPEALRLAEEHVRTNRIDTSQLCLSEITVHTNPKGNHYWQVLWTNADTNRWVSGAHFWIRVHMDRRITLVPGE
jgi:hypothetical protein